MISIIVPAYNVVDYLDDCITSILQSSYRDIEVIVVDDGSTDGTGAVGDKYALQDHRCKVLHTTNGGLSAARNKGIAASKGEYVAFLDGDDFVHPEMYEYLYNALKDHPEADYSICNYYRSPKGMNEQIRPSRTYEAVTKKVLAQGVIAERMFGACADNDFLYLVVWNKLYRRSVIEGIDFIESGAEDIDFNVRVLPRVKNAVLVDEQLHYWVQRPTSYLHEGLTKRYIDRVDVYDRIYKTLYAVNPSYADYSLEKFCKIMLNLKRMSCGTDKEEYTKAKLKPYLNPYMKKLFWSSTIPLNRRWAICFFNLCPSLYSRYIDYKAHKSLN